MEYLIKVIPSDAVLSLVYVAMIAVLFSIKRYPKDEIVFIFGGLGMIVSELFFIKTGVETFERRSLFGLMPVWLPILWAYGFVVIKRVVALL